MLDRIIDFQQSLLYAAPAIALVAIAILWFLPRQLAKIRLSWLLPSAAVALPFVCAALLLSQTGQQDLAKVKLHHMEIAVPEKPTLGDPPFRLAIGGALQAEQGSPADDLYVPGYPRNALALEVEEKGYRLHPGPGHDPRILVRGEAGYGDLIPVKDGFPRLIELRDKDELLLDRIRLGSLGKSWRIGPQGNQLTPPQGADRWRAVGGGAAMAATDPMASAPGFPADLFRLRRDGDSLTLVGGTGLAQGVAIYLGGSEHLPLKPGETRQVPYKQGMVLTVARADPLHGDFRFRQRDGFFRLNENIRIDWQAIPADQERLQTARFQLAAAAPPAITATTQTMDSDGAGDEEGAADARSAASVYRNFDHPLVTLGDSAADSIRVRGLPARFLELHPARQARGVELRLGRGASGLSELPLGLQASDFPLPLAIDGDPLRLGTEHAPRGGLLAVVSASDASAGYALRWTGNKKTRWEVSRREFRLPFLGRSIPLPARYRWATKVYPLLEANGLPSRCTASLCFLEKGLRQNTASLLLLDDSVQVIRDQQPLELAENPRTIPFGTRLDFLLLERRLPAWDYAMASVAEDDDPLLAPRRVRRKATFRLSNIPGEQGRGTTGIRISRTEPQVVGLQWSQVSKVTEEGLLWDKIERKFSINDPLDFATPLSNIPFFGISAAFSEANGEIDASAGDTVQSAEGQEAHGKALTLVDDFHGARGVEFGERFTLGRDHRLVCEVEQIGMPMRDIALLVLAAVLAFLASTVYRRSLPHILLLAAAATLVSSRVVFGHALAVKPPHDTETIRGAIWLAVVIVPALVGCALFLGKMLPRCLDDLTNRLDGFGKATTGRRWPDWAWCLVLSGIAGGFFLARLGFALFGFKERAGPIALSIGFMPAHLLLFSAALAWLMRGWRAKRSFEVGRLWWFLLFCGIYSVLQGLTAFLVSDLGTLIFLIPPLAVLCVLGVLVLWDAAADMAAAKAGGLPMATGAWRILPALGMMTPFVFLALTFALPGKAVDLVEQLVPREEGELIEESNTLRILGFADPDRLVHMGTDLSEQIHQDHLLMKHYCRKGWGGLGYLDVDIIRAKWEIAKNDNVFAIFVLAQFGYIGGLALATTYLGVVTAAILGSWRRFGEEGFGTFLGILAALTMAVTSWYMMAANYGFAPFTGRNLYLLGLNSKSDLLEGGILLGLILLAWTLNQSRDLPERKSLRKKHAG